MSFTVFADNLPPSMTTSWLWQIFGLEGKVLDDFMSRKMRRSSKGLFAFVRFSSLEDAKAAMHNLNGMIIRDYAIKLQEPKYSRFQERGSNGDIKKKKENVNRSP